MPDHDDKKQDGHEHQHHVSIQIDRAHFKVEKTHLTGLEIRHLPPTHIGADRDLFLVVHGGADRKISDTEVVHLHDGARFFTAPAQINPGAFGSRS